VDILCIPTRSIMRAELVVGSHNQENGSKKGAKVKIVRPKNIKSLFCSKLPEPPPFLLHFLSRKTHLQYLLCAATDILIKWYCHISYSGNSIFSATTYISSNYTYTSSDDIHGNNGQPAMISLHIVTANLKPLYAANLSEQLPTHLTK
jgi:hypothetical protein